jgi:hypothetical protein
MGTHLNVLQFNVDGKIAYNGSVKKITFSEGWIKIGCTKIDSDVIKKLYTSYEYFINRVRTKVYQDEE